MSRYLSDNVNSFNVNNFNFISADDESKILAWLSPLEPQVRHEDIRTTRVDSVGNWIFQTEEFRSWYDGSEMDESDHPVLFCYGNPGAGKSYISSLVIDDLCDRAIENDFAVACFYFDFAARKEQSSINMLGSLLKQLVSGLEAIPSEIVRKFRDQKKVIGGRGLQLPGIVEMFQTILPSRRTFICVDALDECVPEHRLEVLDSLRQIIQRSPNIRVFMTGRAHIRDEIERELGGAATSLLIKPIEGDLVRYLRARLRKDTTPEVMTSELEAAIMKNIPAMNSETFLLVSLHIDAILRETTLSRRRNRLNAMMDSSGLGDAYGATLERINAQAEEKARLAMDTLMWISHSERPLQVVELCHALAVEIGSKYFDTDNVPLIGTLISCCHGLITVDKEASTVRLIHFTLQEYLCTHPQLFGNAHSAIAEVCLTYLNSQQIKGLSVNTLPDPQNTPFLKYSSRYWGTHTKTYSSEDVIMLALKLLNQYDRHISARSLLGQLVGFGKLSDINTPLRFTWLHCVSFFGLVELAAALIEAKGCNINERDCIGRVPLIWAAQVGNDAVVKLLLEQEGVDPDSPDKEGETPLFYAARRGHVGVVELLLGRSDVSADKMNNEGRMPLSWAALFGYEGVVKLLLEWDNIDPDRPDYDSRAPLLYAVLGGHEGVAKLLLEREDVNPDRLDDEGRAPLLYAVITGQEGMVKLLLAQPNVNSDRPDHKGQSPLFHAAGNGYEGMVKMLLEREDVNRGRPDNAGRTPLSYAALCGHEEVARLFLEHDDVDPDQPDNTGRTPLLYATLNGHAGMVKLLLAQRNVNPDRQDEMGRSPLLCAAAMGFDAVVKLLLEREDVNPDQPDNEGRTALSCAASNGHEEIVKLLEARISEISGTV